MVGRQRFDPLHLLRGGDAVLPGAVALGLRKVDGRGFGFGVLESGQVNRGGSSWNLLEGEYSLKMNAHPTESIPVNIS